MSEGAEGAGLGRGRLLVMAAAAGIAVANIYYNQPMLGLIEAAMPGRVAGLVPTATQLGYAAGLFLVVPLGDVLERRRLIVAQFGVLAVALALAALAPGAATLVLSSLVVGSSASVAQQILPFAAHLAAPDRRGQTVGTVMAGILVGILLSRTLAGFVASALGWRAMFWIGVPMALLTGATMHAVLPVSRPAGTELGYRALIRSLGGLWREFGALRRAALTQGLLFAAFSVFWTTLALRLQAPPFGMGPEVAGLFGIVGLAGVMAAPLSGRIADARGPGPMVVLGAALVAMAWVVFGLWTAIPGLVVGVILLDFGAQSAMPGNQHIVFALRLEARSRLNTVLVGTTFLGGALGSATGAVAWGAGGWPGVVALGLGFSLAALAMQLGRIRAR